MAGEIATFQAERPRLTRLAYRMLGSVSDAQDVVQDAWLRWDRAGGEIADPAAWLVRVTSRLCLDRMRKLKVQRALYRGPWLPEPYIEVQAEDPVEQGQDVSIALMLALERLSPLERAVFLLHDVFDSDYPQVARTLERTEAAVRQLASRARSKLRSTRPRYKVTAEEAGRLSTAFMAAAVQGDLAALSRVLTEDAVLITDGGGKRSAALRPLVGPADILSLINGLKWRNGEGEIRQVQAAQINGGPGLILTLEDGLMTLAFEAWDQDRLAGLYLVRNPDKLRHLNIQGQA
ncbi:MAG: RNA polymerase sigma factor SigJ [Alphaproteobacteria bacterium PA2]|nr:MAG: RNA polymerase sigma factor SigJ [Alphaproteobacteria bacterium PA2]